MSESDRHFQIEPDYHETEEALPLIYNLGRLSLEWNMVEHYFTCLIWEMLGDYPVGMAITGGMGNQSKTNVILKLAREKLKDEKIFDRVEFACKAFNILRENRNILIHSHSVYKLEQSGKPIWTRATGRGKEAHARVVASFEDLENLIAQICELGKFVTQLLFRLNPSSMKFQKKSKLASLPEKFALPRLLLDLVDDE